MAPIHWKQFSLSWGKDYYSDKPSLMFLSLCFPPYKQQIELDSQTTVDVGEEEQTLTCTYTLLKDLPLSLTKTTFCYSALVCLDDLNKSFWALLLIP